MSHFFNPPIHTKFLELLTLSELIIKSRLADVTENLQGYIICIISRIQFILL